MCFRPDSGQNVFQSTPPRGRRRLLWLLEFSRAYISIHASAREATLWRAWLLLRMEYFNPRLREGGDSTYSCPPFPAANFNPRLREGGDLTKLQNHADKFLFQSTPPRGRRRPGALQTHKPSPNFNPRLREGGDPNCRTSTTSAVYFNPRLREGGDHPRCRPAQFLLYFNPRLREGGDRAIHQPV